MGEDSYANIGRVYDLRGVGKEGVSEIATVKMYCIEMGRMLLNVSVLERKTYQYCAVIERI